MGQVCLGVQVVVCRFCHICSLQEGGLNVLGWAPSAIQALQTELGDVCKWSQVIPWRKEACVHFYVGGAITALVAPVGWGQGALYQGPQLPIQAFDAPPTTCTM